MLNLQKNGNVHRSQSVPDLIKGTQSDSLGGVFRIIPTTPHVAGESGAASISTQPLDSGNSVFKVTPDMKTYNFKVELYIAKLKPMISG